MEEDLRIKAGYVIDQLGWCGCGHGCEAREAFFDLLCLLDARSQISHEQRWKNREAMEDRCGVGLMTMLYYFLDSANLTEHGTSVPGWLTSEGQAMVDFLREVGFKDGEFDEGGVLVPGSDPWEQAKSAYREWRDIVSADDATQRDRSPWPGLGQGLNP